MLELDPADTAIVSGGLISTGPWPSDPPLPTGDDNSFLIDQLMRAAEQQEIMRWLNEVASNAA